MAHAADLWRHFGLTQLTVWEVEARTFHHLMTQIEQYRRQEEAAHGD